MDGQKVRVSEVKQTAKDRMNESLQPTHVDWCIGCRLVYLQATAAGLAVVYDSMCVSVCISHQTGDLDN